MYRPRQYRCLWMLPVTAVMTRGLEEATPKWLPNISHTLLIKWIKLWNEITEALVGLPLASTRDPHFSVIVTVAQVTSPTYTDF